MGDVWQRLWILLSSLGWCWFLFWQAVKLLADHTELRETWFYPFWSRSHGFCIDLEPYRCGTESLLPRHQPYGVSVNRVNLPSPPTWPDSNSKLYLLSEEQQLKFLSTFQLLLSVGFPPCGCRSGVSQGLQGTLYTVLRLLFLWLPSCQNFSIQLPASLVAPSSVFRYLKSITQQPSAYSQLLCAFQTKPILECIPSSEAFLL